MLPCTHCQSTCEHVRYHETTTALIACHGMHSGCFLSSTDANDLIWVLFQMRSNGNKPNEARFSLQGCASSNGSVIKPD